MLIVVTLAEVGGAQTYVAHLVPALTGEFDVTVAAWGPGPLRAAVEAAGARYVPLRYVRRPLSPLYDLLGLVELVLLCLRIRPSIVHANSSKAGVLARVAARLTGVPSRIFTVHGWAFAAYRGRTSQAYLLADRAMRRLTTAIVCVAENERRLGIRAGTCDPDRTVVVHNAVDVAGAARADPARDEAALLSVGRFTYPKDPETLLRAAARLPAGGWRLQLVGDGPDRERLEELQRELGLEHAVEFLGARDDVPALLAAASAFVLSSRSEGLPLSVIEAMAAGLPIVASDVGGLHELVEDGSSGLLVPAGDVDALADALRRLVADPAERQRLGNAARARAEERFDLPAFRAAHLALYRRELARTS